MFGVFKGSYPHLTTPTHLQRRTGRKLGPVRRDGGRAGSAGLGLSRSMSLAAKPHACLVCSSPPVLCLTKCLAHSRFIYVK